MKINILLQFMKVKRRKILTVLLLVLAIGMGVYFVFGLGRKSKAATMELDTSIANQIQVDVANRYRAIMHTNDSNRFIDYYDRSESDSSPDNTQYSFGPWIIEGGTAYGLTLDDSRKTTILEVTATRIRVQVEGCLDTSAGGACLTDGSNTINVIEDYTFTPFGVYVNSQIDFQSSGVALDSSGSEDGFVWAHLKTDITDGAFDDSASPAIYYGDGETESSTTTDGVAFEDTNKYVTLPGSGNYQSVFVSVPRSGWFDMSGGTDDWYYDENDSGTGDEVYTREQGTTPTGVHHYAWQVHFMDQANLDTEAEREALANSIRNPDYPVLAEGETWYDGGAMRAFQTTGGASTGLWFDGDSDYVTIPSSSPLRPTNITVSAWIKPDPNTVDTYAHIVGHPYDTGGTWDAPYFSWRIGRYDSTNNVQYFITDSGGYEDFQGSIEVFNHDQWFYVTMVYDGETTYGYVNGVSDGTDTLPSGNIVYDGSNPDLVIGRRSNNSPGEYFGGSVDEVRIYNRALSQAEVQASMYTPIQADTSGLVAYWKFDEGTGSTVHDETANNNDGSITQAVWTTGYVPDQHNQAEEAYTFTLANQQALFDLDAGSNNSILLNGAVNADASSITTDTHTFLSQGVGYIDGDKFSYTGTTGTTFTGIPTTGNLAIIGHADNTVVSIFNRNNPFFKLRGWRSLNPPLEIDVENVRKNKGTDYNSSIKPVSYASFDQDITWYSTLDSETDAESPDIGTGSGSGSNGVNYNTGKYGNAASFDGANDYLYFPATSNIDLSGDSAGVIEFWMQPDWDSTSTGTTYAITGNFNVGSLDAFSFGFCGSDANCQGAGLGTAGYLYFQAIDNFSPQSRVNIANSAFSWQAGDWVHVRLVWDDTLGSNDMRVFLNGVEPTHTHTNEGSLDVSILSLLSDWYIGDQAADVVSFDGKIDEYHVYDTDTSLTTLAAGGDTSNSNEYLADESNNHTFSFASVSSNRGEYAYFGTESRFTGLNVDLATVGVGSSPVVEYEYWDGFGWRSLNVTGDAGDNVKNLLASGSFWWADPGNWSPYSVNGSTDLYFVRAHLESGSYSTAPVENLIKTDILTLQYFDTLSTEDVTFSIPANTSNATEKGGDPVALWLFDENYGTTTGDTSGNGHTLTISGASWFSTSDERSSTSTYLAFDGANDYLTMDHSGDLDFDIDSFTLSTWFRHASSISGTDMILTNYDDAGYKLYMNSSGYICFSIKDDSTWSGTDDVCTGSAQGSYADSRWHHIEAVKIGTSSLTLYIDGRQVVQNSSLSETGSLNTGADLYIGIDSDGSSNPWDGFLDTVIIYPYARSAAQAKADYLNPMTAVQFGK